MLDVPADKAQALIESTSGLFAVAGASEVVFDVPYDEALADSLVAMGPSAHHHAAPGAETPPATANAPAVAPTTVTAAVDVLAFTPFDGPSGT
jgi:hypothetical protein